MHFEVLGTDEEASDSTTKLKAQLVNDLFSVIGFLADSHCSSLGGMGDSCI